MSAEFDRYAPEYSCLLRDPMRDGFAGDPIFFHLRKWLLIQQFFARQRFDPATFDWLDVGCGQGELLNLGGKRFRRASGCDPSSKMIQSSSLSEIYEQPSPASLPFPTGSFDFVTAVCVFHHVHGKDRELLMNSIHGVLRPGGVFSLIEHNPWNPVTRAIVKRCPVDTDAELLTGSVAAGLIRSAGFKVVEIPYFLYFPERLFKTLGWMESLFRKVPLGGQYAVFARKPGDSA